MTAGPRRCPPERGLKIIGYLVAGVVLLTCAGCDKAGPADGDLPSSSTSASPVPTTVAPSSESTTTAADALARAERDLRTAQAGYYAAYMAAVAKPNDAQALAHLLEVYKDGSPGRRGMQKYVKTLAKSGFAARRGPKSGFTVDSVDVSSVAEGSTASVLVCTYDDGITYDAKHDGPDGKPIVIDDSITSAQTKFRYLLQAGRWKLTGGDVLKTWDGENRCSAKA